VAGGERWEMASQNDSEEEEGEEEEEGTGEHAFV
jgi:hypothetical protein